MERKIGEVFEFKGIKLRVEAENNRDCNECYFQYQNCERELVRSVVGYCAKGNRQDETGVIFTEVKEDVRSHNVGSSDYSKHTIQPWDMWIEYRMNPFDADIQKRLIRKKTETGMTPIESRIMDYKKIIHICQERIRQLENGFDPFEEKNYEE